MAKNFKNKDLFDTIETEYKPDVSESQGKTEMQKKEVSQSQHTVEVQKDMSESQRKLGRPKTRTEEMRTINVAIPMSVFKKLDVAKACYGNSITRYVNKAIERDLESNYSKYESIFNNLNDIQ